MVKRPVKACVSRLSGLPFVLKTPFSCGQDPQVTNTSVIPSSFFFLVGMGREYFLPLCLHVLTALSLKLSQAPRAPGSISPLDFYFLFFSLKRLWVTELRESKALLILTRPNPSHLPQKPLELNCQTRQQNLFTHAISGRGRFSDNVLIS